MEVHAHTHTESPPAGRAGKRFKHYLWEFLMLFLAVFCGFLAENFREQQVEHQREKEYMVSLVIDIKRDIQLADSLNLSYTDVQKKADSLIKIITGKEILTDSYPAYKLLRNVIGFNDFISNDGTIDQLKNNGGLRLIRNKKVVALLMEYEKAVKLVGVHQQFMNSVLLYQNKKSELFNEIRFYNESNKNNIPLLNPDAKLLNWAYSFVNDWRSLLGRLRGYLAILKKRGDLLLVEIEKQYHLK